MLLFEKGRCTLELHYQTLQVRVLDRWLQLLFLVAKEDQEKDGRNDVDTQQDEKEGARMNGVGCGSWPAFCVHSC